MQTRKRCLELSAMLALVAMITSHPAATTTTGAAFPVHADGAAASLALLTLQPDDGPNCRKNPDDPRCRVG